MSRRGETKATTEKQNKTKQQKLQANTLDEYRCKNPQQNVSKPNAIACTKDQTP